MPTGIYDRSVRVADRKKKACSRCRVVKKLAAFHKHPTHPDGRQAYCAECMKVLKKERLPYNQRKWFSDRYGITPEQFDARLVAQGNCCAICKGGPKGNRWGRFCVDHDHATGQVRGIICGTCNLGLGRFQDSAALLRTAAEYLDQYRALAEIKA